MAERCDARSCAGVAYRDNTAEQAISSHPMAAHPPSQPSSTNTMVDHFIGAAAQARQEVMLREKGSGSCVLSLEWQDRLAQGGSLATL